MPAPDHTARDLSLEARARAYRRDRQLLCSAVGRLTHARDLLDRAAAVRDMASVLGVSADRVERLISRHAAGAAETVREG